MNDRLILSPPAKNTGEDIEAAIGNTLTYDISSKVPAVHG